jgi:hypothetical protein
LPGSIRSNIDLNPNRLFHPDRIRARGLNSWQVCDYPRLRSGMSRAW